LPTIQRLEKYEGISSTVQEKTLNDLKRVFEMAGVEFIGTPEDRPGVRFKASKDL